MIVIRNFENKDFGDLYRLLSNPEVMKYLEPSFSEEKTREFLNDAGMSDSPLIYAVDVDNVFAGYVIYHDFDENSMEIGWVLLPEYWEKGIATKLTEMLIEKATAEKKDVVIECVKEQAMASWGRFHFEIEKPKTRRSNPGFLQIRTVPRYRPDTASTNERESDIQNNREKFMILFNKEYIP